MKKNILFLLIFAVLLSTKANNNVTNVENAAPVWTPITANKNTMIIYARVYKNNALFQPTGLLLAVFKNDICYGVKGLTAGPGGIMLHQMTMGCNNDSEDGFTYKVYDPTTDTYYAINETVNFRSAVSVGKINVPIQLNIVINAIDQAESRCFSVYPNPVESNFTITMESNAQNNTLIQLFNISGKLEKVLYVGQTYSNQEIIVKRDKSISKGVYFITVRTGFQYSRQKVIFK